MIAKQMTNIERLKRNRARKNQKKHTNREKRGKQTDKQINDSRNERQEETESGARRIVFTGIRRIF